MHCTKSVARVRMPRSKVKVTGDRKKRKNWHFVRESFSGVRSSCGIFSAAILEGASMTVGKSAHAV